MVNEKTTDAPEWLTDMVQDARRLLGVGDDWQVSVNVVRIPGGDAANDAACTPDAVYLNADLDFAPDLQPSETTRAIVLHEVLHIAHAELDALASVICEGLPKSERLRMRDLYDDANERTLQRISRAMARHIRPQEGEEDAP